MMDLASCPRPKGGDVADGPLPTRAVENQNAHLLVVDDDPDIRDLLADYLRKYGYRVDTAANGEEMFSRLAPEDRGDAADRVNLIVLDIMMPGEDGLSLCRHLRAREAAHNALSGPEMRGDEREIFTPVIFLTALGEATDKVVGLELGADDYVVKPFQPRELLARIRAVLRRTQGGETGTDAKMSFQVDAYLFNRWRLDLTARHLLDPDGMVVNLSGAEYRLLRLFLEHPHDVLGRDFLQDEAQGRDTERSPFDRSLDVQVCRLRARLRDNGREARLIKTVRGDGYVFTCNVTTE